jgi:hypothetical protein
MTVTNLNLVVILAACCSHCGYFGGVLEEFDPTKILQDHCEHLECLTLRFAVWFSDDPRLSVIVIRYPATRSRVNDN